MPYPTKLLTPGEELVVDLRPHWWFFAGPALMGLPALAPLIATLAFFDKNTNPNEVGWAVTGLSLTGWAGWFGLRWLRWYFINFVVTSRRLIFRSGIFAKQGREIPLERINDITFNQTAFERVIGAGDLMVESAGERGQQLFTDIPKPDWVQQQIYQSIEALLEHRAGVGFTSAAAATSPVASAVAELSLPDQIAKLADLRDRGAITEAEFASKKAELLARM